MPKSLPDDLVRSIRERAWRGENPADLALEHNLRPRVVRRMIRGETHKSAGGPTTDSIRRVGERRICTRCKKHHDEEDFIFIRCQRTGICRGCQRPEDEFLKMDGRIKRSLDIKQRHKARREELAAEIELIMQEPLIDAALAPSEAERAEIYNAVLRQKFTV